MTAEFEHIWFCGIVLTRHAQIDMHRWQFGSQMKKENMFIVYAYDVIVVYEQ